MKRGAHSKTEKKCKDCGEVKPNSEYSFEHSGSLKTRCKPCDVLYHRAWREKNKEHLREYYQKLKKPRKVRPLICIHCGCHLNEENRGRYRKNIQDEFRLRYVCKGCINKYASQQQKKHATPEKKEQNKKRAKEYYYKYREVCLSKNKERRNTEEFKAWRKNNYKEKADRKRDLGRQNYKKHADKIRHSNRQFKKRKVLELADGYIKQTLGLKESTPVSQELLGLKKAQLILHREIKKNENPK